MLDNTSKECYEKYQKALEMGVARELARTLLPVNVMTEWYWKIDLHNLLRFLSLRMDPHAQKEIRDYANAMFKMVKEIFPITCEAFEDYQLNSIKLSALEIEAFKTGKFSGENKREEGEWLLKEAFLNDK